MLLNQQVAEPESARIAPAAAGSSTAAASSSIIAVTSQATRSPASAVNSSVAIDAICPIPVQRWDWEALVCASSAASGHLLPPRFGGWMSDIEMFDAALFGISGVEAQLMDAQQRMLLELSLEALTSSSSAAGTQQDPNSISQSLLEKTPGLASACVAVGIASAEYNNYLLRRTGSAQSAYSATGGALSVASGRLAFTYGFKGAALSVDTACSSSLVATHFAASQLKTGSSLAGVIAGVGILLSPDPTGMFQKAGRQDNRLRLYMQEAQHGRVVATQCF